MRRHNSCVIATIVVATLGGCSTQSPYLNFVGQAGPGGPTVWSGEAARGLSPSQGLLLVLDPDANPIGMATAAGPGALQILADSPVLSATLYGTSLDPDETNVATHVEASPSARGGQGGAGGTAASSSTSSSRAAAAAYRRKWKRCP